MEKTNHRWAWLYTQCSGMKLHHNTTRDKCNKFKGCLGLHGEVYFFAYRCGPTYCRLELGDVISHTPVTVHLEYRCTSHILSEKIRPHHAVTPRPALVEGPGRGSSFGLACWPTDACTGIPRRVATTGPWCGRSRTPALCWFHDAGCTCDVLFHAGW